MVFITVVIWLSHGNLLRGFTRLCASCKVFLELRALKDPICWAIYQWLKRTFHRKLQNLKMKGSDWNIDNLFKKIKVQIRTQNGHVQLADGNCGLNSFLISKLPWANRITDLERTAERASWVAMNELVWWKWSHNFWPCSQILMSMNHTLHFLWLPLSHNHEDMSILKHLANDDLIRGGG